MTGDTHILIEFFGEISLSVAGDLAEGGSFEESLDVYLRMTGSTGPSNVVLMDRR